MKIAKRSFAVVFAILLLLTTMVAIPSSVNATDAEKNVMRATYNPNPRTFYGYTSWGSAYYDGNYMKVQAVCTSSDNVVREVTISIYVSNTNTTYNCITYTDGYLKETIAIPVYGGSDAEVYATCSDSSVEITADVYMYSYY